MSGAAMDNPVSSINVKVSPKILDNNQWSYQAYPGCTVFQIFWTDKLINADRQTKPIAYPCMWVTAA